MVDYDRLQRVLGEKVIIPLLESRARVVDVYKNVLDPFSAMIDSMINDIDLDEWVSGEERRQLQKTLQNKVGDLHELIIDCIPGWESLPVGNVIDVVNHGDKAIAEIKNKYNTTKGNHKVAIYDDLSSQLADRYQGYVGYYVEILPRKRQQYNEKFTPPDNTKGGERRPARADIRRIDGKSFYELATGDPKAIEKIYNKLPDLIGNILIDQDKELTRDIRESRLFKEFLEKAYDLS